jgi:hypothetical protein
LVEVAGRSAAYVAFDNGGVQEVLVDFVRGATVLTHRLQSYFLSLGAYYAYAQSAHGLQINRYDLEGRPLWSHEVVLPGRGLGIRASVEGANADVFWFSRPRAGARPQADVLASVDHAAGSLGWISQAASGDGICHVKSIGRARVAVVHVDGRADVLDTGTGRVTCTISPHSNLSVCCGGPEFLRENDAIVAYCTPSGRVRELRVGPQGDCNADSTARIELDAEGPADVQAVDEGVLVIDDFARGGRLRAFAQPDFRMVWQRGGVCGTRAEAWAGASAGVGVAVCAGGEVRGISTRDGSVRWTARWNDPAGSLGIVDHVWAVQSGGSLHLLVAGRTLSLCELSTPSD